MKKSKVIIPAMALLLFSTAASITGTVAWFSSTRVYSMTAGDFSVAEVDGGLECTLASGAGTTADNSAKTITVASDVVLIDASVCHTTATSKQGHAFRLSREVEDSYDDFGDSDDTKPAPASSELKWLYKSGKLHNRTTGVDDPVRFFVAVSWTMTFKYNFATEPGNVGVYLDVHDSAMAPKSPAGAYTSAAAGTQTEDTKYGFRIGFFGSTVNHHNVVWSNNKIGASGVGNWDGKYVQKEADTLPDSPATPETTDYALGTYSEGNPSSSLGDIIYHDDSASFKRHDDEPADDTDANDFFSDRICTIPNGNTTGVAVTCVAWFEGTDPNVISGAAMQCMTANMTFYARNDAYVAP